MNVLVAGVRHPEPLAAGLRAAFPAVTFTVASSSEEVLRGVADAEVVVGHVSREQFLAAGKLRWIQYPGAGVDWMFSIPELLSSAVILTNTRGAQAATIAEHTFGMLIALARGFPSLVMAQHRHQWVRPLERPAVGLSGLTLGIVGLGQIGLAIASRARAFEMTVIAVDPAARTTPPEVSELRAPEGLPWLLAASDAVVVTAPLTPRTRGLIGERELSLMKPSAFLVHISRGGVVDEPALVRALRTGRLGGAGLDVQVQKPVPAESVLWDTPNLFLTPHCSGESRQTDEAVFALCRDNLGRWLAGSPLVNVVDKARGF
jgi:phosphoglycerate dehydrogenase-like enzyme